MGKKGNILLFHVEQDSRTVFPVGREIWYYTNT